MCLTPSATAGVGGGSTFSSEAAASPGGWPCTACTYLNPHGRAFCEVCSTRAAPFSRFLGDDIDPDELSAADPSVGSVFLPLKRCKNKRPAPAADARPLEKMARTEKEEHSELSSSGETSSGSHVLKFLSYNVWFREDLEVYRRMEALGNLILEHLPDFICFQEVTPNIYEIFQSSKWWKAYRCSVSQDIAAERQYFCMQMSKRLVIATSHLESPCPSPPKWDQMYSTERVAQAKQSLPSPSLLLSTAFFLVH